MAKSAKYFYLATKNIFIEVFIQKMKFFGEKL
jgi:hypothetical protein